MEMERKTMKKLYGITIAMITPFSEDNQVDHAALAEMTNMLVEKGVNCLYPCGTTGEMLRLSVDERKAVAETVIKAAAGRVNVFIHCGAVNQEDTIALAQHAEKAGADGVGVVTPIFAGQSDREMEEYFVAVASGISEDFPMYLYNIPQCSSNDLKVEVAQQVVDRCKNVVGLKYSFADINRTIDYLKIGDGTFEVLHGLDRGLVAMLALGCVGTVTGCACIFPEPYVKTYQLYCQGKLKEAQMAQRVCVDFTDTLRGGSNMAYFKAALTLRGLTGGHMRASQLDLTDEELAGFAKEVEAVCQKHGVPLKLR